MEKGHHGHLIIPLKMFGIILIISSIYVLLFSFSTSPLYPYYYGGDSAQFQTVGKAWLFGKIPYRDMFDHKGPLIFFVDMLGYAITNNSIGIMIIQIICMSVTMLFIGKLCELVSRQKLYKALGFIISLIILSNTYGEGNFTEEYCLPFITASLYFQVKYISDSNQQNYCCIHNPIYALLYGITFGVCFLTRVTNAISISVGVLIITLLLLYKHFFKNLINNIVFFLLGFFIILLPFSLYFIYNKSFYDFLYCTFLYNVEYKEHMVPWVLNASGDDWKQYLFWYFPSYCIFFTAIFSFYRRKKVYAIFCLLIGGLESYLFLSGALYNQYAIITIPQIVLFINEIVEFGKENDTVKRITVEFLISAFTFFLIVSLASSIGKPQDMYNKYTELNTKGYEGLLSAVPHSEKDSFVAYGMNEFKSLYLLHDILPYYKYFVIQEWHSSFSELTKSKIHDTFLDGNVKWILTDNNTKTIQDVLDSRYLLYSKTNNYKLYRLK